MRNPYSGADRRYGKDELGGGRSRSGRELFRKQRENSQNEFDERERRGEPRYASLAGYFEPTTPEVMPQTRIRWVKEAHEGGLAALDEATRLVGYDRNKTQELLGEIAGIAHDLGALALPTSLSDIQHAAQAGIGAIEQGSQILSEALGNEQLGQEASQVAQRAGSAIQGVGPLEADYHEAVALRARLVDVAEQIGGILGGVHDELGTIGGDLDETGQLIRANIPKNPMYWRQQS